MYLGGGRLMDVLGTRRGFLVIMIFWSLACASHGLATNVIMLAASRLLLGIGEGGGFPAATCAIAEWFPVKERSTAMGIINAGTAVGAVIAPPLIALVILHVHWLQLSSWRWVFFITGTAGLLWTVWWVKSYFPPENHPGLTAEERARAFDRFWRVDHGTSGSGLGLWIANAFIAANGGKVNAVSEGPGLGTTVDIELPVTQAAVPQMESDSDE
jgi:MFS family permease